MRIIGADHEAAMLRLHMRGCVVTLTTTRSHQAFVVLSASRHTFLQAPPFLIASAGPRSRKTQNIRGKMPLIGLEKLNRCITLNISHICHHLA